MVDPFGKVDPTVNPMGADVRTIGMLWKKLLDVPDAITVKIARRNDVEHHGSYQEGSAVPIFPCTLISDNNRGNATIYHGSETFKADQIGRILDVEVHPFAKCQVDTNES
jgi:hypothetical protein